MAEADAGMNLDAESTLVVMSHRFRLLFMNHGLDGQRHS